MTGGKKPSGLRKGLTAYGDAEFSLFLRTAFIKAMGYSDDALARPIVGIANTYSGYNACHQTVPLLVEAVRRGVQQAGGLAIDFPTISLHESFAYPTSMLYRNLMAMDTEEMLGAQPMDAVAWRSTSRPSRCTNPSPIRPACSIATSWPWIPRRCSAPSPWTRWC